MRDVESMWDVTFADAHLRRCPATERAVFGVLWRKGLMHTGAAALNAAWFSGRPRCGRQLPWPRRHVREYAYIPAVASPLCPICCPRLPLR